MIRGLLDQFMRQQDTSIPLLNPQGLMDIFNLAPQSTFPLGGLMDFNAMASQLAGPLPDLNGLQTPNLPSMPQISIPVSNPSPVSFGNHTIIPLPGMMQTPPFISSAEMQRQIEERARRIQPAPVGAPIDPGVAERIRLGLL